MQLPYIDDRRMALYGKVANFVILLLNTSIKLTVTLHLCRYNMICIFSTFCVSFQAFGGYLTLKMLAATDQLFQCTAAVAPITDFRLYGALRSCQ